MSAYESDRDRALRIPLFAQLSYDERRQSMRFPKEPGTDFASIVHPPECEGLVEVADESLGGIAIVVDDGAHYTAGMSLELVYAGGYMNAEVRHISRRSDGRFIVGLLCQ